MNRVQTCRRCGQSMVPLIMGLPSPEDFAQAERGEIVLGGCIVGGDEPEYVCVGCGPETPPVVR